MKTKVYNIGDKVRVEFDGTVIQPCDNDGEVLVSQGENTSCWVSADNLSKINPALPIKEGAVILADGDAFQLYGGFWQSSLSGRLKPDALVAVVENITILYTGDDE